MIKESILYSDGKYRESCERLQPFKLKMIELVNRNRRGRILDIGCGSGSVSRCLDQAGWQVVGIDISGEGISRYAEKGFSGALTDAERGLPFKKGVFDAVWISEVVEHLVDFRNLFQEIRRVLKPSGRVYLTTPNSVFYGYRLLYLLGQCPTELQHPYHVRFFSFRYITRILAEAGFAPEKKIGQNIYFMIPRQMVQSAERLIPQMTRHILRLLRITKVPGLIHGDKYLLFRFSSFFPDFFSNAVMVVAKKTGSPS